MAGKADSVRTILYAPGANLAIAVAKMAAIFTGCTEYPGIQWLFFEPDIKD